MSVQAPPRLTGGAEARGHEDVGREGRCPSPTYPTQPPTLYVLPASFLPASSPPPAPTNFCV